MEKKYCCCICDVWCSKKFKLSNGQVACSKYHKEQAEKLLKESDKNE